MPQPHHPVNLTHTGQLKIDNSGMRDTSLDFLRKHPTTKPIRVEVYPDGVPFLADGRHRLQVAIERGDRSILAEIITYDDAANVIDEKTKHLIIDRKLADIAHLASTFYKAAAIFEAPPAMVAMLTRVVKEIYAATVLYRIPNLNDPSLSRQDDSYFDYYRYLQSKALQYHYTARPPKNFEWKMRVDLTGWKYLSQDLAMLYKYWIKEDMRPNYVNCRFIFGKDKNYAGLFEANSNTITIYIDNLSDNFDHTIRELEQTVRHEVQHFGQTLLSDLLRKDSYHNPKNPRGDMAGLPSDKIRSKEYNTHGISLRDNKRTQADVLQDIEFYTYLQDNVNAFKHEAANILRTPDTMKSLFNMWVGLPNKFIRNQLDILRKDRSSKQENKDQYIRHLSDIMQHKNMFKVLLEKEPAKWKKAVNVFYTQVQHLL